MAIPARQVPPRRREFGLRVQELRTARRMTQEQLAHASELDRTYISGVERGVRNVGVDNLFRLADALGVSPSEFF